MSVGGWFSPVCRGRKATAEKMSNGCVMRGLGRRERGEEDVQEVRRLCWRIYRGEHHLSFGLMGVIQFRILNEMLPAIIISLYQSSFQSLCLFLDDSQGHIMFLWADCPSQMVNPLKIVFVYITPFEQLQGFFFFKKELIRF